MFSKLNIGNNLILGTVLFTGVMIASMSLYVSSVNDNTSLIRSEKLDARVVTIKGFEENISALSDLFNNVGPLSLDEKIEIATEAKIINEGKDFTNTSDPQDLRKLSKEYESSVSDLIKITKNVINDRPAEFSEVTSNTLNLSRTLSEVSKNKLSDASSLKLKKYKAAKTENIIMVIVGLVISALLFTLIVLGITRSLKKIDDSTKKHQLKIRNFIDLANRGNFDERLNIAEFEGSYKDIALGLNNLMNSVVRPQNLFNESLKKLSNGDLTSGVKENFEGNFGDVKTSLNRAINNLHETISKISETARSVSSSVIQFANANIEQTHNLKINLEYKDISMMKSIEISSRKISSIVNVIDDVAFQTGIVAFNASLEAAKAGDSGKGFSVVADEVKNLAGKSVQASREIKELVLDNIEKIKGSANIFDEVNNFTNFTRNMVEQNNIYAEALSKQAEELLSLTKLFKIDEPKKTSKPANQNIVGNNSKASDIKINTSYVNTKAGWEEF